MQLESALMQRKNIEMTQQTQSSLEYVQARIFVRQPNNVGDCDCDAESRLKMSVSFVFNFFALIHFFPAVHNRQ